MPIRADLARLRHSLWVLVRHGLVHRYGERARRLPLLGRHLPPAGLDGPERLRQIIEDLGGTFVKFGQMLALQPDILPKRYCDALFELMDRVTPFPFAEARAILRRELGREPEEIFDSIEAEPLATASIGQVHVAWLAGEKVAVKVQRPNAEIDFGADLRLMAAVSWWVRTLRLRFLYWILEPTSEFREWTREELDFRYEARYTNLLRRFARDNPVQVVPRVWDELVTQRVLVVEFLDGQTLLAHLRSTEAAPAEEPVGFDRRRFAANVIDNFLGDAFGHGIYHADLHPANLMILDESVVGYIDFGITGVMSRHARRHLVAMTLALSVGDMDLLGEHFLQLAAHDPAADPTGFRHGLAVLAAQWYEPQGDEKVMRVNFTRIMTDMLHLSRRTHLLPERDIVKYIRSSIAIDGLVTRFEPDFDVGHYLAERCSRYLLWQGRREQLSPERLLDWAAAAGRLARHGPQRLTRRLETLAARPRASGARAPGSPTTAPGAAAGPHPGPADPFFDAGGPGFGPGRGMATGTEPGPRAGAFGPSTGPWLRQQRRLRRWPMLGGSALAVALLSLTAGRAETLAGTSRIGEAADPRVDLSWSAASWAEIGLLEMQVGFVLLACAALVADILRPLPLGR